MKPKTFLLLFALLATFIRLFIAWHYEPTPQETYYYLCAQQPAPAYFDGPSGTAILTSLLGEYWKLAAPLWALAATYICYLLVRRLSEERFAVWTALGLNLLPLFNAASVQAGPTLPTLTLLCGAILSIWNAYEGEPRGRFGSYLAAAAFLATGVWFSYTVVPFAFCLILFVLCSPKHRLRVDYIGLFVILFLLAAALSPALEWNARQDWIPIAGGTFRTLWQWDGAGFLRSLVESLIALSPLICVALPAAWVLSVRTMRTRVKPRLIFLVGLPGVVLWFYLALRGKEATLFLLLAAPLLLFHALTLAWESRFWRATSLLAALVGALLSLTTLIAATRAGEPWKTAADTVREIFVARSTEGEEGLFLIAQNEPMASVLGYQLRKDLIPPIGHPAVYVRESQAISGQFGLWPSYDDFVETEKPATDAFHTDVYTEEKGQNPFIGRSALYISEEEPGDLPQTIKAGFTEVTLLQKLPTEAGRAQPLYIYLCRDYQTVPL